MDWAAKDGWVLNDGVAYVFAAIARRRAAVCVSRSFAPHVLREALPNRTYTIPGKGTFAFSDLAVIGTVTGAVKGPAYAHPGDDVLVPVDFDDPLAAERAVDVRVAVEDSFGSVPPLPERVLRVGLGGARDQELFIDGLRSLGRVAVVLQRRQDRDGEALIPVERCSLLGLIDGSGRLRFPGLGADEHEFVDGIATAEDFRAAASSPNTVVVLADPDV